MRKQGLKIIALATMTLTLAACQQFDSLENEQNQDTGETNETTQQLSKDYYQAVIEDEQYETNPKRGLIAGTTSEANMRNIEKGLYQLAQRVFPTDEFMLREGTVISEDQTNNWLGAQSDDNPDGLNPSGANADNQADFEPRYLNSILEYDLLEQGDNNSVNLKGISIALAMNASDTFTNGEDEQVVAIDRETQITKGKEMAEKVVAKIRENNDYKDIPIQVALFANADESDQGGGTFVTESMVSEGTKFGDWVNYNRDYVVYGVDEAPTEEDAEAFTKFRTDVENFFPQMSGITGVGYYEDDHLNGVNITINSQFDGYTETIALAQKAIDSATNLFNKNLSLNIKIIGPSGTTAILSRPSGADNFNYTVL